MKMRLLTLLVIFSACTLNAGDKKRGRTTEEQNKARDERAAKRNKKPALATQTAPANLCTMRTTATDDEARAAYLAIIEDFPKIIVAAIAGNSEKVQELVTAGVDINTVDRSGNTPLHHALAFGQRLVASDILAMPSSNPLIINQVGHSALVTAAGTGNNTFILAAIDATKYVGPVDRNNSTLLHVAAGYSLVDIVKRIVEEGILDVNSVDLFGNTALHYACFQGEKEVVKILLRAPLIDLTIKNKAGKRVDQLPDLSPEIRHLIENHK